MANRVKKFEEKPYSALEGFYDDDEERRHEAVQDKTRELEKKRSRASKKKTAKKSTDRKPSTVGGGGAPDAKTDSSVAPQPRSEEAPDLRSELLDEVSRPEPERRPPPKRSLTPSGRSKPSIRVEFLDEEELDSIQQFVQRLQRRASSKVSLSMLVRNQLLLLLQSESELEVELRRAPVGKKPANYFPEQLAEYEGQWLLIQDRAMRSKRPAQE